MTDHLKHSRYGGSIAERWMNCAGSVALCDSLPARPSSSYADEGTWAHALAAYCLNEGHLTADDFRNCSLPLSVEVPPQYSGQLCGDLVGPVNVFLAAVYEELARTPTAELFVEHDVVLPIHTANPGEVFGRLDAAVWHPSTGRLRTFDYKHGAGVFVEVENNPQPLFYTVGFFCNELMPKGARVEEIVLTIVQPRPYEVESGQREAVRDWTVSLVDLQLFHEEMVEAVAASKAAEKTIQSGSVYETRKLLKVGDWCRWCDAAAVCPAQEKKALETAKLDFASVVQVSVESLPDPKTLDMDHLEALVAGASLLASYAAQCQGYLESLLMAGHKAKGWKVVDKIGRRKYVADDEQIIDFVDMVFGVPADVATRTTLQTLTDMKKILKQAGATKDQLDDFELRFTLKESSGLTIAPISDKRPSRIPSAADYASVNIT